MISADRHIAVINSVSFSPPDMALVSAYEEKKMAFIKDKLKRWYESTQKKEEAIKPIKKSTIEITAEVIKNKSLYLVGNKISLSKIADAYGIGRGRAQDIANIVKNTA